MIRLLIRIEIGFARSRLRRDYQWEPRFKNFSSQYEIQKQVDLHRKHFEINPYIQSFSALINSKEKVKLKSRFELNEKQFNKRALAEYKEGMKIEELLPVSEDGLDLKFLEQDKSHLLDQSKAIEFEKHYKKELFTKQETNRLIEKERENFKNYLPEGNKEFIRYEKNRNRLKNSRIDSMMSFQRNNAKLQLLIESGFVDQPENLAILLKEHEFNKKVRLINQNNSSEINESTEIIEFERNDDKIAEKMLVNVIGPKETRDKEKLMEFLELSRESTLEEREKTEKELRIMFEIKDFEKKTFEERYNALNFRFKGQVQFSWMHEGEMMSYIKHTTIDPHELLLIVKQNESLTNKFGDPILTPAVLGRVYTKTSTYEFPEDDNNNKINMLNDKLFQQVEKKVFRNLEALDDSTFCDVVYAYSENHNLEQGILNVRMSQAISRAIHEELTYRISYLLEEDLGLILRAFIKMPILKDVKDWKSIIEILRDRLPEMVEPFEVESVLEFISLTETNSLSINTVAENIFRLGDYKWDRREIVIHFSRIVAFLFRNTNLIENKNTVLLKITEILSEKEAELVTIMPEISINSISIVLTLFQQISRYNKVPEKAVNSLKKCLVDNIAMQKELLNYKTITNITTTLSFLDYQKSQGSKIILEEVENIVFAPHALQISSFQNLFSHRVFNYNSKMFFVYHELATLLLKEKFTLDFKQLSDCILGLSLVGYKNEGLYDEIIEEVLRKTNEQSPSLSKDKKNKEIDINNKEIKVDNVEDEEWFNKIEGWGEVNLNQNETRSLMRLLISYSFQKRSNSNVDEIVHRISCSKWITTIETSLLISYYAAYVNLIEMPLCVPNTSNLSEQYEKWEDHEKLISRFPLVMKTAILPYLHLLELEEIIVCFYVFAMLYNNVVKSEKYHPFIISQLTVFIEKINPIIESKYLNFELNHKFLYLLSKLLIEKHKNIDEHIFEKIKEEFELIEKEFFHSILPALKNNEFRMGIKYSYKNVEKMLIDKLKKENSEAKIIQKPFRIENLDNKKVYFLASYEHIKTRLEKKNEYVGLFGMWKMYEELYKISGWEFETIITPKEG